VENWLRITQEGIEYYINLNRVSTFAVSSGVVHIFLPDGLRIELKDQDAKDVISFLELKPVLHAENFREE
jgi:hypothetical protein